MPPTLLIVTDLAKSYGAEQIFSGVNFQLNEREHVALVGVNGAGKSTVLKIIAGIEHATAGDVALASGLRVTYLPQEARFDSDRSIREEAQDGFATRSRRPSTCARSSSSSAAQMPSSSSS